MIKQTNSNQAAFDYNFTLCNRLSPNNRWVRLADQIPCLSAERQCRHGHLKNTNKGAGRNEKQVDFAFFNLSAIGT